MLGVVGKDRGGVEGCSSVCHWNKDSLIVHPGPLNLHHITLQKSWDFSIMTWLTLSVMPGVNMETAESVPTDIQKSLTNTPHRAHMITAGHWGLVWNVSSSFRSCNSRFIVRFIKLDSPLKPSSTYPSVAVHTYDNGSGTLGWLLQYLVLLKILQWHSEMKHAFEWKVRMTHLAVVHF